MVYSKPSIFMFSLIFLFILNNTRIPIPEPTSSPPIIDPKLITLLKYNCVIITEPAQFGINPTIPDIKGPTIGIFSIRLDMLSSPTNSIIVFNTSVISSINKNIFKVCFIEDFNIPPSSQWHCSCSHICPICFSIIVSSSFFVFFL